MGNDKVHWFLEGYDRSNIRLSLLVGEDTVVWHPSHLPSTKLVKVLQGIQNVAVVGIKASLVLFIRWFILGLGDGTATFRVSSLRSHSMSAMRKNVAPVAQKREEPQYNGETLDHCSSCRSESNMRWTDTK
jgi:hypothetical protein